jgi:large subunit ribosomal protein L3
MQDPGKVWRGKKMPGRMGGKTRTVQNLKVVKIDSLHNLIYIKGAIPGTDNQYVRVSDAIKKSWFGNVFPENAKIPFPTFLGSSKELERELLPQSSFEDTVDPFARTRREKP